MVKRKAVGEKMRGIKDRVGKKKKKALAAKILQDGDDETQTNGNVQRRQIHARAQSRQEQ